MDEIRVEDVLAKWRLFGGEPELLRAFAREAGLTVPQAKAWLAAYGAWEVEDEVRRGRMAPAAPRTLINRAIDRARGRLKADVDPELPEGCTWTPPAANDRALERAESIPRDVLCPVVDLLEVATTSREREILLTMRANDCTVSQVDALLGLAKGSAGKTWERLTRKLETCAAAMFGPDVIPGPHTPVMTRSANTPPEVTARRATEDDVPWLVERVAELRRCGTESLWLQMVQGDDDRMAAILRRVITDPGAGTVAPTWVAEQAGARCGLLFGDFATFTTVLQRTLHAALFWVDQDEPRGTRAACALLDAFKAHAHASGATRLSVSHPKLRARTNGVRGAEVRIFAKASPRHVAATPAETSP